MPQSLSRVLIHLVFSTKGRQPVIIEKIESELYSYIAEILYVECYSRAVTIGGDRDHIHILFEQSRTFTVAKAVEIVKKRSSKWIKTKGDEFRMFQWQIGYAAYSVSGSREHVVRKYIENQKEHHKKISFQDEFRVFLEKHSVDYSEKYVWD